MSETDKKKLEWFNALVKDYPQADPLATKALIDLYFDDPKQIDDIAEGKVEVPQPISRNNLDTYVGLEVVNDSAALDEAKRTLEKIYPTEN